MELHKKFSSYQELQNSIELFEKENCVQFWKRDAKTLKSAEHHSPNLFKKSKAELKYYKLKYACIHGGQKFRPKNKNNPQRNHQGTWKQDCRAHFTIGLTKDGQSLIIKSMNTNHNHKILPVEVFKQLPKQRRLSDENKKSVLEMMKLKVNKKLLQAKLVEKTGNSVLLRDLANIAKTTQGKDDLQDIVNILKHKFNCTVDVQTEDNTFRGIFFQDNEMKKCFSLFPEVVFLDGTYKLLNNRCPVYVIAVENSFGNTDIAGIAILTKEDSESLGWLLATFKQRNLSWKNINVVMTDKSAAERDVIAKELPHAKKLICLFHTFQIFQREITTSKLNIQPEQVKNSLEYISKLIYAKSENEYSNILSEMKIKLPASVIKYFLKNWEPIKHEWAKCFTKYSQHFYNFTNNRLESLNAKLKSVISIYSTFDEFINKLFILIKMKRIEKQNIYSKMILKVPKQLSDINMMFYNHVTYYAYKQIEKSIQEVQLTDNPYIFQKVDETSALICMSEKDNILVSTTDCQCSFFTSMKLPCKHILFYRQYLGLQLFSENLFNIRWTRKYIEDLNVLQTSSVETLSTDLDLPEVKITYTNNTSTKVKSLTSHDKFKKVQAVCLKLSTLCSEVSTEEFQKRMNILIKLEKSWQALRTVEVINVEDNQDNLNKDNFHKNQSELGNHLIQLADHNYFCNSVRQEPSISLQQPEITENIQEVLIEVPDENVQEVIYDMNYEVEDDMSCFHNISLPSTIKQRGRPKGRSMTAIGLPKKRRKLQ